MTFHLFRIPTLMLLVTMSTFAMAQTAPMTFTYQGQLLRDGVPFSGSADLEFELFADPDGNALVGFDAHPAHPVSNGLFQVELNFDPSIRGLPTVEFAPLHLGIKVDGHAVTPLQAITPAPLAYSSAYAFHAATAGAPWEILGNDLQYVDGRVGIGRAPSDYVSIDSGLAMQDSDYEFGTGALRVMVRDPDTDGPLTKFRVLGNGGVAIGNSYNSSGVPVDGLRVHGDTRLESQLWVDGHADFEGQTNFYNNAIFHSPVVAANFVNGGVIIQELPQPFGFTELCRNDQNFITQCSASSARYKEDVVDLTGAGELIRSFRAVSFRWIESGKEDIGLIAEEVAAIEPRLATYNSDGEVEGVNYRHLTAVLVAAYQEQQAENSAALAARDVEIATLRDEVETRHSDIAERLAALEVLLTEGRQPSGGQ